MADTLDNLGSSTDKARLREQYKRQRATLGEAQRRAGSLRIYTRLLPLAEVRSAQTIFCFISHGTEVETHDLIETLLQQGRDIVIPKILPERRMVAVRFPGWKELAPGTLGIPAPVADHEFAGTVDLCITPGLAFTPGGERLGHGRGYYDRWLAAHPSVRTIAPAFECQLADSLPTDAHDIRVNAVVTEDRLLRCEG